MTTSVSVAVATRNAQADILSDHLDGGYVDIYSGTVPATADTPPAGNTLLARLPLQPTASGPASSGTVTFDTTGLTDSSNDASGVASFFRCVKTDGTTVVMQGQVGTSGFALNLADVNLVATGTTTITSFTHTVN